MRGGFSLEESYLATMYGAPQYSFEKGALMLKIDPRDTTSTVALNRAATIAHIGSPVWNQPSYILV